MGTAGPTSCKWSPVVKSNIELYEARLPKAEKTDTQDFRGRMIGISPMGISPGPRSSRHPGGGSGGARAGGSCTCVTDVWLNVLDLQVSVRANLALERPLVSADFVGLSGASWNSSVWALDRSAGSLERPGGAKASGASFQPCALALESWPLALPVSSASLSLVSLSLVSWITSEEPRRGPPPKRDDRASRAPSSPRERSRKSSPNSLPM
mmetsp:Transcript_76598/g.199628  ORF Transcript_76598/g.199628 Transcript_76598/m.199628 type:complete len:210 (+) Transcript_76598:276-905(+)